MSLVAYGASDDSGESDAESHEDNLPAVPISDDEDDFQPQAQTINSGFTSSLFSNSPLDNSTTKPAPTQKSDESFVEETELEQEVRQKPSEIADAPKPPPKRTKQPVKITIPSLEDLPDEDEGEGKQKPVASATRSGLFSLLPAPIHSAKKEINRPLIPHSLGRKNPPAKPSANQPKPVSSSSLSSTSSSTTNKNTQPSWSGNNSTLVQNALAGYGSDSDDEDDSKTDTVQNFFSLGSTTPSVDISSSNISKDIQTADKTNDGNNAETKPVEAVPVPEIDESVVVPEPGLTNDSPLTFSSASRFSSWSSASSNYLGGLRPSQSLYPSNSSHYSYPQESSVQYNMIDADADPSNNNADDELQKVLNDKEFQRLNGKRKRGREEAISFVDAKVDDYVDPSELSKYVTEESEYAPKKNKDDMPTNQQKRKKQITYLAFQAKEKELELKNTWSQNKMTKRQTQAKYGF